VKFCKIRRYHISYTNNWQIDTSLKIKCGGCYQVSPFGRIDLSWSASPRSSNWLPLSHCRLRPLEATPVEQLSLAFTARITHACTRRCSFFLMDQPSTFGTKSRELLYRCPLTCQLCLKQNELHDLPRENPKRKSLLRTTLTMLLMLISIVICGRKSEHLASFEELIDRFVLKLMIIILSKHLGTWSLSSMASIK